MKVDRRLSVRDIHVFIQNLMVGFQRNAVRFSCLHGTVSEIRCWGLHVLSFMANGVESPEDLTDNPKDFSANQKLICAQKSSTSLRVLQKCPFKCGSRWWLKRHPKKGGRVGKRARSHHPLPNGRTRQQNNLFSLESRSQSQTSGS